MSSILLAKRNRKCVQYRVTYAQHRIYTGYNVIFVYKPFTIHSTAWHVIGYDIKYP